MDLLAGNIGFETLTVAGSIIPIHHSGDRLTGEIEDDMRLGARRLDQQGLPGKRISVPAAGCQMFRTKADGHCLAGANLAIRRDTDRSPVRKACGRPATLTFDDTFD